jgi:hypothetical protein
MPVIGVPVTPEEVVTPSRLIATPTVQETAPCCDTFPAVQPVPTIVTCQNMNVLAVDPTQSFKKPLFERIRTIRVSAGQQATISWQMQTRDGNPVKLTDCTVCESNSSSSTSSAAGDQETIIVINECRLTLKFRMHEQAAPGLCRPPRVELPVTVTDAEIGKVAIALSAEAVSRPGIYFGEVAVVGKDSAGTEYIYFSNTFYLAVEPSNWQSTRARGLGPPTFAEVRLHLRDSSPNENLLLSDLMFDDAEISMAISRPIQYWNEIPPPIQEYTTQTFPFRYHWLEAIAGELFLIAAEGYRKNHLAYSAAGVAIDDQNKEMNYEQAALRRLTIWKDWVLKKKASMNLEQAYGVVQSSYSGRASF